MTASNTAYNDLLYTGTYVLVCDLECYLQSSSRFMASLPASIPNAGGFDFDDINNIDIDFVDREVTHELMAKV